MDQSILQASNQLQQQHLMPSSQHSLLIQSYDNQGQQKSSNIAPQKQYTKNVNGGESRNNLQSSNENNSNPNYKTATAANINMFTIPHLQTMVAPPSMVVGQTFGTQVIRKQQENQSQHQQRLTNGTPQKTRGTIKKQKKKMNGGGNNTDEEDDQLQQHQNRFANHRSSLSNQPPMHGLHNAVNHFEESPQIRHAIKQKANNLAAIPQHASNRLPSHFMMNGLPEALGIIDSQKDDNSSYRANSNKVVQQKKGSSIPQQQQVVQSFINQSKFGGQQSQILQDIPSQPVNQNYRNLTTSGSRKLSVNQNGGGGTASFQLRGVQPNGANSQQKYHETRIAANAAFNNHKQHLITTMTTLPDYSSDEEPQQMPLPMSTRFRNNGGDYTDAKKQGNSTSELGFQQQRTVSTVNPSFFPAGKRQKNKGSKKLLPTQQLQPTGITYTSGGGKIFDYLSKPENAVSLQSPMLMSQYNSKHIHIDEQQFLNKMNPQQQSREALIKNKNTTFALNPTTVTSTTTDQIVTPSKIRSIVGVSGHMQLSNQQSLIQQANERHFFTSQSIQQQPSNIVNSPEQKKKQSPANFYQSPQSQMTTKHNFNILQSEKPTLMNGNGQKLHSSNALNQQHPLLTDTNQLNLTAPGTQEQELMNNSLDLDENLADIAAKGSTKKGANKKNDQLQMMSIQQQPVSFSQFDPQFPSNPYNKRLNSTLHSTNKKTEDLDPITRGIPKQLTSENVTSQLQKYTKLIQFEELPQNTQNTVQYVKMMQKNAAIQQIQQQSNQMVASSTNRVQQQLNKGAFTGITGHGGAGGANFLNQTKKTYAQQSQKQTKAQLQLQQWQLQMQQQQILQQSQWPQGSQTMKLQPDFRFSNQPQSQHVTILQDPKEQLFSQTSFYNTQQQKQPMLFTTQNEPVQLINVPDPNIYYKQLGNALQQAQAQLSGVYSAVINNGSQFRGSHGQGVPGKAQQSMLMGGMLQTNNVPPMIIQQTQLYTGSTVNNQFKQVGNNPGATRIVDPNSLVGFLEIQRVTMALPGTTANNQNCNHHKQNDQQFLLSHPTNSVEKIHLQQRPQCCAHLQPHQPQMYQFLVQSPQVSGNAYLLRKQQQNNKFGRGDIDEGTAPVEIKQVNQSYLYFTVIPGNNSGLIRDAMLRRSNKWREASSFNDPTCHFRWQPVSYGLKFDQLGSLINPNTHAYTKQLVNHFECHGHLTEKSKLFKNLQDYALTRLRENVFNYIPLTFYVEVDISKTKQFAKAMLPFFNSFYALEDNKKKVVKYYEKVEEFNSLGLAMQQANANTESQPVMAKSMGSLPNLLGSDINNHQTQSNANLIPKPAGPVGSAGAPIECPLEEAFIFKHFYNNRRGLIKQHLKEEKDALDNHKGALKKNFFRYTMPFCHFTGYNLWLLKPTKLNRGRGIHVINNLTQLKALIQRYCEGWSKPNGVFTGNTVQPKAAQRAIEGEIIEQSPDKEGGAEMGTDEEEESPTTQPSSTLPPLTQEETNGSKLNTQPASLQMTQQKPPQQQPQYKIKHNSFILQKYIEKPFLIYQRKFDIRVWVFLNYDSSLYFFPEGYLRTSSSEFAIDPNNPDDQYVHLTNNAIQKYSQSYGVFEDGNQMSYAQFQDYLDSHGFSGYSVKDHTVEVMKSLIMRSMLATRKLLDPQRRRGCFELFGYDFILDEDFNTWLIEVNTNPCIEESSKILKVLIPRMLDDMLKLSVDQYFNDFQPKKRQQQSFDADDQQNHAPQQTYRFPVPGYDDDENMWEFMCKLGDKKSKKEAKARYVTQAPLPINSKFAFQVKDREFKIKKYLQPTVPTAGGPTTAGVSKNQEKDQLVAAASSSSPQLEGDRSASGGITENLAAAGS